ncbi:Purine nucleoside phosphorylase 1 [Aquisphaera giovannonii]|uniref:Purine nucleoside phosphorylase n=1 Tax=Aquisphaera giovannonii TaxID=406548 RepID=A0A5B9WA39_9BACT|nr:purine-nucleoside phosphorylase [Aquisphaera giovannonii]QEH36720.1 Purine nucleoside phosphorylase 1 [Aquisphaera giovannonii]
MSEPVIDLAARAAESALFIKRSVPAVPPLALVLGSGLNELAEGVQDATVIPYRDIPHFPVPTVAGHAGNLLVGRIDSAGLIVLQGRFHYYEGHPLEVVTFPMRVLQFLGVRTVILTAATGGIRADLRPGNLVCLSDHLNLIGDNPLRGSNDTRLGTRFPDMTEVYSKKLRAVAREEGKRLGINVIPGVYACLPGPSYETPAEIRMLQALGADVVGMSTVPEAIVARHGGMDVLAFALVTNSAAGVLGTPISHKEVLDAGKKATPLLGKVLRRVALRLSDPGGTGLTAEMQTFGGDV